MSGSMGWVGWVLEAIFGRGHLLERVVDVFGVDLVGFVLGRRQPSASTEQVEQPRQAAAGAGQQVDGRGGEGRPVNANLAELMLEIGLNLGAIQRRQPPDGADARIEGFVMLHAQGVLEVEIAHEHESEDGLARQIESEQEANFFEGARWIELGFVQHHHRRRSVEFLEGLFQQIGRASCRERVSFLV